MKLWEIFRFEVAYQLRRGWTWLIFATLVVLCFLMQHDNTLAEALYTDFFVNAPFTIAKTTMLGGVIWLLAGATIAGEAAARDVTTRMYPLVYATPLTRAEYLGGRFLAAFALNALMLVGVQAGILLAVYAPDVNPKIVAPFRPAAYLTAFAFIGLPNAFVGTALQFACALRAGRAMAAYLGSLLLLFMAFFVASFLLFRSALGSLLDPIGMRFILEDIAHQWTTIEQNHRLVLLEGTILTNRLVWMGVGLATLAITYARFGFEHRAEGSGWLRRHRRARDEQAPQPSRLGVATSAPIVMPAAGRTFGFAHDLRQTIAIARASFHSIATSWAGLGALILIPLMAVPIVVDQMVNGVPLLPATMLVLRELTAPLSAELSRWVIVPLLTVFFAGELAWRERDARVGEITDAMPGSDWAPLVGKFLGLGLVLALLLALLMVAGAVAQLLMGYHDFDFGLYVTVLFGLQLPEYLLFALLALAVHVIVDQKYVGHLVAIVAYVFIILSSLFGVDHDLLVYGASPAWTYTPMRGFGPSIAPWLWFKLYWAAWALLIAVVARLLWVRGRETGFRVRMQWARRRFARGTLRTALIATVLIAGLGGFVFYNTNVLNTYLGRSALANRRAEYERRYGRFANAAQPQISGATLRVEIYPERRMAEVRGTYRLVNGTGAPIDSVHLAVASNATTGRLVFDRPATAVADDSALFYRIYALGTPLQPGDTLRLEFTVLSAPRGFSENGVDPSVVKNGTFFTNALLPAIGYQRDRELLTPTERREHGLPARPVIPSLYDTTARAGRGARTDVETVVGTSDNQVAVAPGRLQQTWAENGRRYFRFATDVPIGSEWSFASADYVAREATWNGVPARVYYDPRHTRNLDEMLASMRACLDYYGREFGPYRFGNLTVVERPGEGQGMHADASFISFGDGFSLWNPRTGDRAFDLPYAVVAHETAHQWTVPSAPVEGAPVMSESIAWYYAMKLVEHTKGRDELERLRRFMRQPYPYAPIRRGEPLLRGLDPYLSYRKGPFALYALSEYAGESKINGALRRLLEKHDSADAPLATTLDLLAELQAATPDSLRYLVHDLFEVNTFWELETTQVSSVQTAPAAWRVTLDVRARKVVVDSAGVETEVPMNELVEVGVYDTTATPLFLEKRRIHAGTQTITITVPRPATRAGIDPNYLLMDLDPDDNVKTFAPKP
jgi:ABC-type transport system involved in multi-copper enzyme maturation permease subunit